MKNSVVILAAGFGTRMKSELPKPLHKISGKSLIEYVIENALKISDDVSVILYHQADLIKEKLLKYDIKFIIQDMQNHKGTGGALFNYSAKYENTIVLNADMPLVSIDSLNKLINNNDDISIAAFNCYKENAYGRLICNNLGVQKIVETKDANKEELKCTLCNGGIYKIKSELIGKYIPLLNNNNAQNEYYLTDIIKMAIDDKKIVNYTINDEKEFIGINSKLDLEEAENIMQEKIKNHWLKEGVIMHNKNSIYIDFNTTFIGECELESGVVLKGLNTIKNSKILANSVIEDSYICNSSIGPLARIRPKCEINDSKIGNFVECKNAKLNDVKAGHLAYLGDCEIKSGVNIGCGVIICNYDGKKKHLSKIGENVFVGSNSNLIAPIDIPNNTIIAAGSTISGANAAKLKEKDLFIERSNPRIINNYKDF